MLELYRASAGSGKTYTLAKKFLWYFLTISEEGSTPRLRSDAELADSVRHILAVTFTNKATNEMQMRIVDSLYALATQPAQILTLDDGTKKLSGPEYLADFVQELKETPERIAAVSAKALNLLLENYSDFNVSTIDSFFQQVLRTFAYESDINDTYQVELDSAYLSQVGVDATLEEIDNNAEDTDTLFWIKTIVERTEKGKWNIFAKTSDTRSENPYGSFISSVKKMETEQYKLIRDELEEYFKKNIDFVGLYKDLCNHYERPVKDIFQKMKKSFSDLYRWLPEELKSASSRSQLGAFAMACKKIKDVGNVWNFSPIASKFPKLKENPFTGSKIEAWLDKNPEFAEELKSRYRASFGLYAQWKTALESREFRHWRLYSVNLPYFALFKIVAQKRKEYLDEMNAIELGETSMLLQGVIDKDDAPFVYERIGSRLNHFLIDEFQDTSKMQWANLLPLLKESMGRGNGNLIIGDAKQSIYRFRNADPSLITTVVPRQFKGDVSEKGNIPEENTNYRSDLHIVSFNNQFFKYLASEIDSDTPHSETGRFKFADLYSNVVQTPFRTKDEGYVEINFGEGKEKEWHEDVLSRLRKLIYEFLERGYRQKDIAILVRTHDEGAEVIEGLQSAASDESGLPEIRFVSEQSLKVASSAAVSIITGILENLARGSNPEIRTGEERRKKGVGVWNDLEANFKFYRMQHPDMPISEVLRQYFEHGTDYDVLSELLDGMQSMAIPAVVEAIISKFIPEKMKETDALYLSAFQDLIIEYCESHPTDVGSFLKWWERKSYSASVASPEDTDAIQVVTVHKSKGLQYECVIVPFADWEMGDEMPSRFKREWLWVTPEVVVHPEIPMPPYLPVETSDDLYGTNHEPLLEKFFDLVKMDRLNAAYVALTRAKKELYIFTRVSKLQKEENSSDTTIGRYLRDFVLENEIAIDEENKAETGRRRDLIPQASSGRKTRQIKTYQSIKSPEFLKYKEENQPEPDADVDIEDLDPRSEGNIKHAVLEHVEVISDLPKATRHLCNSGLIPYSLVPEIERSLSSALRNPKVKAWFDGSAKVINERPVLEKGSVTRRPDRLLIYPDGRAVVIDYKFGHIDETGKYNRQISRYMRFLKATGNYSGVEGYLWYVNEDEIRRVEG